MNKIPTITKNLFCGSILGYNVLSGFWISPKIAVFQGGPAGEKEAADRFK
jgi:hypothetical protein